MRVSVIGAGYIGLVTGAGLAHLGHEVVCIDTSRDRIDSINQGMSPLLEEGLEELLSDCAGRQGNLKASLDYEEVLDTDLSLICVGTPSNADGSIKLSHVRDAAKSIGRVLREKDDYHVVAVRSTVVPGTTMDVIAPLLAEYSGKNVGDDIGVASNPEFLQEGKALQAFLKPDRIVIGELDSKAGEILAEVYDGISAPVFRTDITTAEMIKYASNAFLATKISFINEIANICHRSGVDVYDVVTGLSFDYRIGDNFLSAGIGFGGSCLPKDLRALAYHSSAKLGYQALLLTAVMDVNDMQALKIVEMAETRLANLDGTKFGVLGLAFKPGVDDVRDAPAERIIRVLLDKGALVKAYDPHAMENARKVFPAGVEYCDSAAKAIEDCDCVLILTEWNEFRDESLYQGKIVIDGRRALDPRKARLLCDYQGVCW